MNISTELKMIAHWSDVSQEWSKRMQEEAQSAEPSMPRIASARMHILRAAKWIDYHIERIEMERGVAVKPVADFTADIHYLAARVRDVAPCS